MDTPFIEIPYITAPESASDDAFVYVPQEAEGMEIVDGSGIKQWFIQNGVTRTVLCINVPQGVQVELYSGFNRSGSSVSASKVTTANGITTYVYYMLPVGNYSYRCSGSGYYTVTKNLYYSEEKASSDWELDIDPGLKAGTGFEPNGNISSFTQEVLDNLLPSSTTQWPGYEEIFEIPYFTNERASHEMTTQDEMMEFLRSLDGNCGNMQMYIIGESPVYGYEIPVILFTKTDLSCAQTIGKRQWKDHDPLPSHDPSQ